MLFLVNIRNFFVLAMRKEVMVKCVESKQVVETKPGVKVYWVEVGTGCETKKILGGDVSGAGQPYSSVIAILAA